MGATAEAAFAASVALAFVDVSAGPKRPFGLHRDMRGAGAQPQAAASADIAGQDKIGV